MLVEIVVALTALLPFDRPNQLAPSSESRTLVGGNRYQLPRLRTTEGTDLTGLNLADLKGAEAGQSDGIAVFEGFDDFFQHGIECLASIGLRYFEFGRNASSDLALA
jgi:hypothetical protein